MNLIHYRYDDNIYKFIAEARVVSCLQEIQQHMRNKQVVYHLAATNKADSQWASLFTGKLGIIAVGTYSSNARNPPRNGFCKLYVKYRSSRSNLFTILKRSRFQEKAGCKSCCSQVFGLLRRQVRSRPPSTARYLNGCHKWQKSDWPRKVFM